MGTDGEHKTDFRARNVPGTFEKQAPVYGRSDPPPPQLNDLNAVIMIKGYLHFKKHLIEMSLSFNNPRSIY